MSALPAAMREPARTSLLRTNPRVIAATARVYTLRFASNPIQLIRIPLAPVLSLGGFVLAYNISGQTSVPDSQVIGFLIIGIFMTEAWSSTVWGSGNALQAERNLGTISAIISAPASTAAVVIGYTLGSLLIGLPSIVSCTVVGLLAGGRFTIDDPLAALVALLTVYVSTVCIGMAFGGLFILSRNSNSLSNVLQLPIYLLAGFYVPRSVLPGWLRRVGDVIPLSHAVDALRGAMLSGESLGDLRNPLLAALGTSAIFLVIGIWALGKADRAIRRSGTLDIL
ncbi:MAG TPA: ABC transporter permease [Thermomicrobiales bacterium]|nr:ABC transporter permease [Thermomicrobiales bacterium]